MLNNLSAEVINDHCVDPTYLEQSLHKSLNRMQIQSLDIFYINNFAESQLYKSYNIDKLWGNKNLNKSYVKYLNFVRKIESRKKFNAMDWLLGKVLDFLQTIHFI